VPLETIPPLLIATISTFEVGFKPSRAGSARTFDHVSLFQRILASRKLDLDILIRAQSFPGFSPIIKGLPTSVASVSYVKDLGEVRFGTMIGDTASTGDRKLFCPESEVPELGLLILDTDAADETLAIMIR
jgi:hypothetical protein